MLRHQSPLTLISLAFIDRRNIAHQLVQEVLHVLLQAAPLSRRQRQRDGHVGIPEVVDIAVIAQCRMLVLKFPEHAFDGGRPARTAKTGDEDVVAGVVHLEPDAEGAQGPFLTDDLASRFDVVRRCHAECRWLALPAQLVGGQRSMYAGRLEGVALESAGAFHGSIVVDRRRQGTEKREEFQLRVG